jgi:hypothetical protein
MPISERGSVAPPDSGTVGLVKGTLLVHLRAFVIREFGEPGWEQLVGTLRPADREVLGGLVLVGAWLPIGVWNRALETFLTANYSDPASNMGRLAKFVADRDLNTLFRLVLKVGSPDFILGRTASLYNRYFESGTFVPQKVGPQHWVATLTVPRNEDQGPGLFSCDAGISAWLVHALELSGVRPTVTHPKCRFNRSPYCQYDLTW